MFLSCNFVIFPRHCTFDVDCDISRCSFLRYSCSGFQKDKLDIQVTHFEKFGKGLLKKHRAHPDAFVQAAIQLGYFRVHGRYSRLKIILITVILSSVIIFNFNVLLCIEKSWERLRNGPAAQVLPRKDGDLQDLHEGSGILREGYGGFHDSGKSPFIIYLFFCFFN